MKEDNAKPGTETPNESLVGSLIQGSPLSPNQGSPLTEPATGTSTPAEESGVVGGVSAAQADTAPKAEPVQKHISDIVPIDEDENFLVGGMQLGDRGVLILAVSKVVGGITSTFVSGARVAGAVPGRTFGRIVAFLAMAVLWGLCQPAYGWQSEAGDYEWRGEHRHQQSVQFNGPVQLNGPVSWAGEPVTAEASDINPLSRRAVWEYDIGIAESATGTNVIGAIPVGWIVYDAMLQVSTPITSTNSATTSVTIGLNTLTDVFAGGGGGVTNTTWASAGVKAATVLLGTKSTAIVVTNTSLRVVTAGPTPTNGNVRLWLWAVEGQ